MHTPLDEHAFAGAFRAGDSRRYGVDLKKNRKAVIDSAIATATNGFPAFSPIHATFVKGRKCSSVSDYSQALILRVLAKFIARRFRVEIKNRDRAVKGVIETLSDSTPIYLVRRDISSFYETLPLERTIKRLTHDVFVPMLLRKHLNCFFSTFCATTTIGLPRGICLSPILAELAMEEFDKAVRQLPGVYKYFRYSDDILIFSYEPTGNIETALPNFLPTGMSFNATKSASISLNCEDKGHQAIVQLEYLGYSYRVSNMCGSKDPRKVYVGISDRKISKLKTKILCCLKANQRDKDFQLLKDRLRFLSGNYVVYRQGATSLKSSKYAKSGIHYNYRLCGTYEKGEVNKHQGAELKALDGFYQSLIRPGSTIGARFNPVQRNALKTISFFKGFELKLMTRCSAQRVQEIKRAWRNV